jgi:nitroreductase
MAGLSTRVSLDTRVAACPQALELLLRRRSVAPRRLAEPAPSSEALQQAVRAGLRAPDHGALAPWRLIELPRSRRDALAELFADEKLRRDPLATPHDLVRAREHATQAPMLLAFVVCLRAAVTVPVHEQWLAAGAALGALLHAFEALGYGAIVLSGERCADPLLSRALAVGPHEVLAGFVSVGTVAASVPPAADKPIDRALSSWDELPVRDARGAPAEPPSSG